MWKRDEAVRQPTQPAQPTVPTNEAAAVAPAAAAQAVRPETMRSQNSRDVVNIGKSVVIKGELNGSEDLTIEGHVEGKIELRDHVLTIGPNGKIKPNCSPSRSSSGRGHRQRQRQREGRHPRERVVDGRYHVAPRGDCRGAHFRGSVDMAQKGKASSGHAGRSEASSRAAQPMAQQQPQPAQKVG